MTEIKAIAYFKEKTISGLEELDDGQWDSGYIMVGEEETSGEFAGKHACVFVMPERYFAGKIHPVYAERGLKFAQSAKKFFDESLAGMGKTLDDMRPDIQGFYAAIDRVDEELFYFEYSLEGTDYNEAAIEKFILSLGFSEKNQIYYKDTNEDGRKEPFVEVYTTKGQKALIDELSAALTDRYDLTATEISDKYKTLVESWLSENGLQSTFVLKELKDENDKLIGKFELVGFIRGDDLLQRQKALELQEFLYSIDYRYKMVGDELDAVIKQRFSPESDYLAGFTVNGAYDRSEWVNDKFVLSFEPNKDQLDLAETGIHYRLKLELKPVHMDLLYVMSNPLSEEWERGIFSINLDEKGILKSITFQPKKIGDSRVVIIDSTDYYYEWPVRIVLPQGEMNIRDFFGDFFMGEEPGFLPGIFGSPGFTGYENVTAYQPSYVRERLIDILTEIKLKLNEEQGALVGRILENMELKKEYKTQVDFIGMLPPEEAPVEASDTE